MDDLKRLSFPLSEYRRRLKHVQQEISRREIDALVVSICANLCYLTGFQTIGSYGYGMYAAIVLPEGDPILFGSDFELHNAHITAWPTTRASYSVMADPIVELAKVLLECGVAEKRIGIELIHHGLTASEFQGLQQRVTSASWVDASDIMATVMCVKSPVEVEVMRKAANLTCDGMQAAAECASPGSTDNHLAAAAYHAIVERGGEYFSLQPIVTSGKRSGIPHSTFRRTTLAVGDTVFIEIAASYERYSAPMLRTICLGEPQDDVRRTFDACVASVESLLEHLGPNTPARDAARIAGTTLRSIDSDLVWHGFFGYSVGLTFPPMCCDCPNVEITESSATELKSGMIFHCSTSLRRVGIFGTTCSETILITDQGCEALTSFPRELIIR